VAVPGDQPAAASARHAARTVHSKTRDLVVFMGVNAELAAEKEEMEAKVCVV
jgi:hypothetical protein